MVLLYVQQPPVRLWLFFEFALPCNADSWTVLLLLHLLPLLLPLCVQVSVALPLHAVSALAASMVQYGMTGMRHGADNIFKHCSIGTLTSLIAVQVRWHCNSLLAWPAKVDKEQSVC